MKNWLAAAAWPGARGRAIAVIAAGVLLLLGLALAIINENTHRREQGRELETQSEIIAASIAPALAFLNNANAQEYLNGLRANPAIKAAAVYDAAGVQVAEFRRDDANPAPARVTPSSPVFEGNEIIAVTAVRQNAEILGSVYLRSEREPPLQRFARYAGVGVLVLLAAVVVAIFGLAQGALAEANAGLRAEIEARARAEEALLQSRKLEAIGQLTGGVAHDFNNLLTVVLSGLRLMERNADPVRRAVTMEAMRQAVERGAGLTKQLLAFARRQSLELRVIDVPRQLQGMRTLLERSLRADILIDIVTPEDLWPVKTDPTQFELAILNLAVNARDAMVKGGVLTIAGANVTAPAGDRVEISVKDTGAGMTPEIIQRVLEPYFTTKAPGQGTGLGLSQVYGIATQSGGDVHIESAPGKGTTVTVSFPRTMEPLPRMEERQAPPSSISRAAGKRVLVVEDDDGVASMVLAMFEQMECRATRVASAEAALHVLERTGDFDVVFSDVIMPGAMNGVELASNLKNLYPDLPIILTTGYSGSAEITDAFPVLRKPYQIEDLERLIALAVVAPTARSSANA